MDQLSQFLLIMVVAVFAGTKVTLQGSASRRHIRTLADTVWFHVLLFAVIAIMLAVFFPMGPLDGTILGLGVLTGITTVVAQCCYAFAFNAGPVSLTVLIANFSILISSLFSAFVFHEKLYLSQLAGVVCLIISMLLSRAQDQEGTKANSKWLVYSLMVMTAFGIGNSVQKCFWITESSRLPNSDITFLTVMYVAASLAALAFYALMRCTGKCEKSRLGFQKSVVGFALAIGASLCGFQKTSMYALANVDGMFYFPTLAGVQSLLMTLVGVTLFHDRLSSKQKLGVVFGILCVALMNLHFGPAVQF